MKYQVHLYNGHKFSCYDEAAISGEVFKTLSELQIVATEVGRAEALELVEAMEKALGGAPIVAGVIHDEVFINLEQLDAVLCTQDTPEAQKARNDVLSYIKQVKLIWQAGVRFGREQAAQEASELFETAKQYEELDVIEPADQAG